ncbi:MAG: PilZ domain-containing protein [Pseudomonadota bacterium]
MARSGEQRAHRRYAVSMEANVFHDGTKHFCHVMDISAGGAALSTTARPAPGTIIEVEIDGMAKIHARVQRHLVEGIAVAFDPQETSQDGVGDQLDYMRDQRQFLQPN